MSVAPDRDGYAPLPVDLEPFRAGTVWHYQGRYAYAIESVQFHDRVRIVRSILGRGGGRCDFAEADLDLHLQRVEWADDDQPIRHLDPWAPPAPRQSVGYVGNQAWAVISYNLFIPDGGKGDLPVTWDLRLRRAWWEDRA